LDAYNTNKLKHYENILRANGFILSEIGEVRKLSDETKKEQKQLIETINDELFNDFLNCPDDSIPELMKHRRQDKFVLLFENVNFLGLKYEPNETLLKYKETILDKYKLLEHNNIIRAVRTDEYIKQKFDNVEELNYNIKTLESHFTKIRILRQFEQKYNLNMFDFNNDFFNSEATVDLEDSYFKMLKSIFRSEKKTPKTAKELKAFYIQMIKNITCNDLVISKTNRTGSTNEARQTDYKLNRDLIKYHLQLNEFKNPNRLKFHPQIIETFNIEVITSNNDDFIDE
jgi:hypothetical protein